MLIKLNDGCYVLPEEISEITISSFGYIRVSMKNGIGHTINNDHGKSPYETIDRLIKEINKK